MVEGHLKAIPLQTLENFPQITWMEMILKLKTVLRKCLDPNVLQTSFSGIGF